LIAAISYGGIFDCDHKQLRLTELERELTLPEIWEKPQLLQQYQKEKALLGPIINDLTNTKQMLADFPELLAMAKEDEDEATLLALEKELHAAKEAIELLEFKRMFTHAQDPNDAFLDIQAGSGGTEAQDWANMLLRMYLRWAEDHHMKPKIIELSQGDVAGIKSATIALSGDYAFGWLRTETGVHRLVRKSPFDSGNRRHTSFASVFVYPKIDDAIEVDLNLSDCRIDTYRSSGAGGQHVNTTDSAVRITHLPTELVAQCQSERSQHQNKAHAINQLKAKIYQHQLQQQQVEKQAMEDAKMDIGWGSQIRSYVLDDARIKDLRTGVESANTQAVLDGKIDQFLEASLRQGVNEKRG
jgi:peptide chain release factor 2